MKKLLILVLFAISAFAFFTINVACNVVHGSGIMAKEKRALSGFTAIAAGGAVELEVTQSDTYSVEVEADKAMLPRIQTTVENGTLKIEMSQGDFDFLDNPTVRVKVSLPNISSVEVAGASQGTMKNIKTGKLNLGVTGASKMIVTGTASDLTSEIMGASKLDAKDLIADNATVDCAGASKAKVHANSTLKINAEGASKVVYSGSAKVSQESSGASNISQE